MCKRGVLFSFTLLFSVMKFEADTIDWKNLKPALCWGDDNYTLDYIEKPIEVGLQFVIIDLFELDETNMDFKCQVTLNQIWKDPFLNMSNTDVKRKQLIPGSVSKCLWRPIFYFSVCKDIRTTIYEKHLNSVYRIMPGGLVYHFRVYTLTVSCHMDFHYFPLDTQVCALEIQFLDSRDSEAHLKWFKDAFEGLQIASRRNILTYKNLTTTRFYVMNPETTYLHRRYTSGNTTALLVIFRFSRFLTSTAINTYIPSFLVVSLSFVSFWLEVTAVPGRVTLGVTALLTLATQMDSSKSNLPRVNYITGLDIWLLGCQILVFLSLIEFIMANSYYRCKNDAQKSPNSTSNEVKECWTTQRRDAARENEIRSKNNISCGKNQKLTSQEITAPKILVKRSGSVSNPIDNISKIIFPASMMCFTFIYGLYFYIVTKNELN